MMIALWFLLAFFSMEFVAWSAHKYLMHGPLWVWHRDHHIADHQSTKADSDTKYRFQLNDLFSLIFALPAAFFFVAGFVVNYVNFVAIASGITFYGFIYYLIHDAIIHNRLGKFNHYKFKNIYLQKVAEAHLKHHRPKNKKDFSNFGLLLFSSKTLKS